MPCTCAWADGTGLMSRPHPSKSKRVKYFDDCFCLSVVYVLTVCVVACSLYINKNLARIVLSHGQPERKVGKEGGREGKRKWERERE